MTAVNFPSSPSNGDTLTSGNTTYTYNSTKTRWDAVTTVNGIQLNSLSVGAEAAASGDGGIAYDNTSGEFTYTPPVIGDSLPSQTDNSGKFLTTNGTAASWATVSAGAGYAIGDGLELTDPVTTVAWPASPVLTAQNDGTAAKPYLGHTIAATADYVVSGHGDGDDIDVYNARTGAYIRTIVVPQTYLNSLDLDGTTLIVGARNARKAYLYNVETGVLIHTLSSSLSQFGHQVNIVGNYAVVSGSDVALSVFNVTTGALLYTINNPNSDGGNTADGLGQYGLALTTSHIIASAAFAEPGGVSNAGIVYIFDVTDGSLLCTRTPPSPAAGARYGSALSDSSAMDAHGDTLAFWSGDTWPSNGTVHVHSIASLIADPSSAPLYQITNAGAGSTFGAAISISGDYLAVGAWNSSAGGFDAAGAAYLYDLTDGSLQYSVLGTSFYAKEGYAVAAAPGVFVTGAHDNFGTGNPGKIRIYNGTVSSTSYLQPDSTIATTSYVDTSVSNLVDSSPAALNTLNELAAALGDDANFSTTVTNSIAAKADASATTSSLAAKAPLADPTFTGVPAAPTAAPGTNTTQLATTAFVTEASASASGGGSKEFIASGAVTAGDPVVLNPTGTVSSVATIPANGATMAAGHHALFPSYGNDFQGSSVDGTNYQTFYAANNTSAVCPTTGRAVFFGVQTYSGRYAFRIHGAVPNASSSEMTLGTPVSLQNTGSTGNINICLSGAGDGNFLVTYNPATSYNDTAGAGLVGRLGNVNSSGEITMYNSVTLATGRPLGHYGGSDYLAHGGDKEWKNSIVWDPIASKFVVVITGDFTNYSANTWNGNTKIATAFLEYNGSNTLSQNGGEALVDVGDYGSHLTKLKSLWDSTRSKVVTLFASEDKYGSANNDGTFHFSVFEISNGIMSAPVAITTPVPRTSLTGTSLVNFFNGMEYNPTQQKFMLIPMSSGYSGTSFFSFAFDGSVVSSVSVNSLPNNLLRGFDNTGAFEYRDITYEASTDSVTIAYSAPNMTLGSNHSNKQSIYTATLSAADYTLLSNIEVYDASHRGSGMYGSSPLYEVAAAYYVNLSWSNALNKFIMFRITRETKQGYSQPQRDRDVSAYSLMQPTSISNYAETIGFSEGTVSDTTSVPVTLAAGINGNQSGLTIDTNYYFQADGSLATTETDYLAGLAISATELQVADLSDLDNVNLSLYASTSALAAKAPLADPTFTGVPAAPTAAAGTNTTQLATTAFVAAANAAASGGSSSVSSDFIASGAVPANSPVGLTNAGTVSPIGNIDTGSVGSNDGHRGSLPMSSVFVDLSYDTLNNQWIVDGWSASKRFGTFDASKNFTWDASDPTGGAAVGNNLSNEWIYDADLGRHIGVSLDWGTGEIELHQATITRTSYTVHSAGYTIGGDAEDNSDGVNKSVGPFALGNSKIAYSYLGDNTNYPTINTATALANGGFTVGTALTLSNFNNNTGRRFSYHTGYSSTTEKMYAFYMRSSTEIVYAIIDVSGASPVKESEHVITATDIHTSSIKPQLQVAINGSYVLLAVLDRASTGVTRMRAYGGYIDSATGQITFEPFSIDLPTVLSGDVVSAFAVTATEMGHFALPYQKSGATNQFTMKQFSLDTSGVATQTYTANTTTEGIAVQNQQMGANYDPVVKKILVTLGTSSAGYGTSGWHVRAFTFGAQAPSVSSNRSSYIGFSGDAVSDTATGSIVLSGVKTGLTGLTAGSEYYITDAGVLTTSPTTTKAGRALSATSLYVNPDFESIETYATTAYVDTSVSNLVDSSPAALNTLNELAAALGDDANFSTTVTNSIAAKAPLADPTFTGVPAAPTAAAGTNTTQLATTAFVTGALGALSSGASVVIADTAPSSPDAGDLWMNSATLSVYIYYNDGSSSQWVDISASSGGGNTVSEVTSSSTVLAGSTYLLDTSSALTVTLPAGAAIGDKIGIIDGTGQASTNNITIARNGHKIQGLSEDMTVAKDRAAFELVYYNANNGWLLTSV